MSALKKGLKFSIIAFLGLLTQTSIPTSSFAQNNNVGIGTLSPKTSALLDIDASPANNKGVLIPRLTAVQRLAIPSPANSLLVFDTDSACFFYWKAVSSSWKSLCNTGADSPTGLIGSTGLTGVTGMVGITGTTGLIGSTGASGNIGSTGYTGLTGAIGITGSTGFIGSTGTTGLIGSTGNTGSVGVIGATGTDLATHWTLTGNAGTIAGTNFIGTTDAVDLAVVTNNTEKMRVTSAGNIGIGTAAPAATAILDVTSTTTGLLVPRMTTAQRNAIVSPGESLLIYNTDSHCFESYYNGWVSFGCLGCQVPGAFSALAANSITQNSFTANWSISAGASGYFIDVSTSSSFSTFVTGFNNQSTGNVISYSVTGLNCSTTYYYRIRANNSCGTTSNSNTITITTVFATTTQSFSFTGADQTYTIPACASFVTIKVWGAGGGEWASTSGAAGYSSATFNLASGALSAGQTIMIIVGKGGTATPYVSQSNIYGFGGGSLCGASAGAGQGGGLSGVFTGATPILASDASRAVIIAGGGGGSGEDDCLSLNFRRNGGSGNDIANAGGMPTMQGIDGNTGVGCAPSGYGGGGGGYYGGTSHTRDGVGGGTFSGNGGSGFVHSTATASSILFTPEFAGNPPNMGDADYDGIAGKMDQNGFVVIISY